MKLTALSGACVEAEVKPYDCGALRVAVPLRATVSGHVNRGQVGQEGETDGTRRRLASRYRW